MLARNRRAGGVELDLVVRRGRRVVFVEVKQRRGSSHGDPLDAVDERKLARLRRGAEAWLAAHPEHRRLLIEIEVAAVRGNAVTRVRACL